MGGGDDLVGADGGFGATLDNRSLDHFHRVFGQQLQDANILPRPGDGAMTRLERGPQVLEAGRQRPAIEHRGMVQGRRPATENGQIVAGFNDPFAMSIASDVTGDHPIA